MNQTPWNQASWGQTAWPVPAAPLPARPVRPATLWQLTSNELYKLWKRRLVWGLLALDLCFVCLAWCVLVFYAAKSHDGFQPGHLLGGANALSDAIGQPLTLGRRVGEFIAVALGGLAFGGEWSSGAIRLVLSRGVDRASYLIAKYLALAVACFAMVVAGLVLSMVLTNFLIVIHQPAPTLLGLDGPTVGSVLLMCGGALESFLFCLLFGAALSIITRSAAFGIVAGFGYLIGEDIAAQILPVIGKSLHTTLGNQIVNLLYTTNLNALYADSLPAFLAKGLDRLDGVIACNPVTKGCVPVSSPQALIAVLLWALILAGVSTVLFLRRDVLQ